MALTSTNKNSIAFKKLLGKGHTQETFAYNEESITSNVQLSYSTTFAEQIDPLPKTDGGLSALNSSDGIVEHVRFEIDIIPNTEIGVNQSQGYRLKLPSGYSGALSETYTGGTYLHSALGKLQIVPSLYGQLKDDGSTEYDPSLYQIDGTTPIPKFDEISWILDSYNGVLFVQDPDTNFNTSSERPAFLDAFLYVGKYLDDELGQDKYVRNIRDIETGSTATINVTDDSDFIGASGTTLVMLPATPKNKHQITIADIAGIADVTNITIDGNGKLIDDGTTAIISTDYGALTLLYVNNFWKVISSA